MAKTKPQIKIFHPSTERPHRFRIQMGLRVDGGFREFPPNTIGGIEKRFTHFSEIEAMATLYQLSILALNAKDAHYQLSIQMESLGWIEGQNWRVTMICPEAEK